MFKVNEYLEIVKEYKEDEAYLVESCADYNNELAGCYIILKKSKLPDLLTFVENNLQNPTYVYNLLNRNTSKGMDLLKSMLKISDYTVEFIKHYEGIQGVLDIFKPVAKEAEKPAPLNLGTPVITDSAVAVYDESTPDILSNETPAVMVEQDANWETTVTSQEEKSSTVTDIGENSDSSPAEKIEETASADSTEVITSVAEPVEESKTETGAVESYNNVTDEENQVPAVFTPEMSELMLMVRAMAAKMGITDDEQKEVMNDNDILAAKMYLNEMAAVTVRDAVIAVLDSANTKEERAAITTFFSMFVEYMKGV